MGLAERFRSNDDRDERIMVDDSKQEAFTLQEVDILIRVIATASFPVKDIEPLYQAILKLQQLRNRLNENAT